MSTLTRKAPAKLNLSLRILGKRNDGFHDLDTLMVKLPGLADRLIFRETGGFAFECDDPDLPTDESNLVVQAARQWERTSGTPILHSVSLEKSIPHGAGLGGGSSDAASALLGLNQLHGDPLASAQLHQIAAGLGSDIPFFLTPGAARCTGRGEIIEPAAAPPPLPVLLLKPGFAVPTPDAYRRFADSRELPGLSYAPQQIDDLTLVNDLERPVFEKHRFLAELKQWLADRRETRAALLSGSGSTVFAILHEGTDPDHLARCARHELDPHLWHWSGKTGS